jgi:hypothetical protein
MVRRASSRAVSTSAVTKSGSYGFTSGLANMADPYGSVDPRRLAGEVCGIPHLAKNERDAPNFLYAALDRTARAPFIKERRIKFREPTKLHRKSGMWGTRL